MVSCLCRPHDLVFPSSALIYTVGSVQPQRGGGSSSLVVRTRRGHTPAVLHQVDRHADLVQHNEALSLDQLRRL